ncbi:hypothetical protein [Endozoicomonas sp. 8E]|uniref:hypothetical protein n=1 Tax=unclassified Endozoicomonas TaxID=2644528 RepID=UPI002938F2C6|nr:hypothetical protein [Endozoicomonas sp. 8E]WOG29897.1 hypothetical protein P6910_09640 [Endozoicomonas sp. 8E]
MATTNIWQQFKALIPEGSKVIATITLLNGNGTSQARLRDGSIVTVKGDSVGVGQKAFIQGGEVKGSAPDLAQYEASV